MDSTPQDTGARDVIITPDSVITHYDTDLPGGVYVWRVTVDGAIARTFAGDQEAAAQDYRGELEARRDALSARDAYTAGLRALADFLDAHPQVPVDDQDWIGPHFYTNSPKCLTADEFLAAVEALDANVSTPAHREQELQAIRWFGPIRYSVQVPKALVCEPRQVTVTEMVLPDTLAAREQKAAA